MGNRAVGERRLDGERAAVGQKQAAAGTKLIAFGVAAKVIVIIEDQYARAIARKLTIEIRGRQPLQFDSG